MIFLKRFAAFSMPDRLAVFNAFPNSFNAFLRLNRFVGYQRFKLSLYIDLGVVTFETILKLLIFPKSDQNNLFLATAVSGEALLPSWRFCIASLAHRLTSNCKRKTRGRGHCHIHLQRQQQSAWRF